jgi:hypothetical protein
MLIINGLGNASIGQGTTTLTNRLTVQDVNATSVAIELRSDSNPRVGSTFNTARILAGYSSGTASFLDLQYAGGAFPYTYTTGLRLNSVGNLLINTTTDNGGKLQIKAPGALSTDIALRVRNSADTTDLMTVDGVGNGIINGTGDVLTIKSSSTLRTFTFNPSIATGVYGGEIKHSTGNISFSSNIGTNGADIGIFVGGVSGNRNASALLQVDTTTRGFLPPRMTTTQKNAIATPASGLVVYDTTLGKLCVRGAASWETITSV